MYNYILLKTFIYKLFFLFKNRYILCTYSSNFLKNVTIRLYRLLKRILLPVLNFNSVILFSSRANLTSYNTVKKFNLYKLNLKFLTLNNSYFF